MYFNNLNWGKTQYLLEKGMDVSILRRKVIADNIANANVPHFKRTEVSFEAQLRRTLDSEKYAMENAVPAKMNHSRHIPFYKPLNYRAVEPRPHIDYLSTMRNDGNNIDIEHEMSLAVKNQLRYQSMAHMINSSFKKMNMVIRSA